MNNIADRTLDDAEVARFGALASKWWDPEGEFAPLHAIGPERVRYLRRHLIAHFARDAGAARPLDGLSVVDIGCGGGLICEPMARLGASVTGVDPARENIEAARAHAGHSGLDIDYRACRVEELAEQGAQFDAVVALEVVEHVPDVPAFLSVCASVLRPGGLMLLSTINRTARAFALAIVGAEYVLRWLPRGTHQWDRFVTPDEMRAALAAAGVEMFDECGLSFSPLSGEWRLGDDIGVNYLAAGRKPESLPGVQPARSLV